jgi:hypothetical protein
VAHDKRTHSHVRGDDQYRDPVAAIQATRRVRIVRFSDRHDCHLRVSCTSHASDLTLVRADLRAVPDAIRLSRKTLATSKGKPFWAFAYNVAALPIAEAGLLNPMIAGAAMAFSSVFVVTNSLQLRRFA